MNRSRGNATKKDAGRAESADSIGEFARRDMEDRARNPVRCWAIAELAGRAKKALLRGEGDVGGMPLPEVLEVIQTLAEAAAGA